MHDTLRIASLCTCDVRSDGAAIRLNMLDEARRDVTVELPAGLAASLILTLARLMEQSLRLSSGDATRLVFPLGSWRLEGGVA